LPADIFYLLMIGNFCRPEYSRIAANPIKENKHQQNHAKHGRDHLQQSGEQYRPAS